MWKDRIKLQRLKEKQKLAAQGAAEKQKPRQSQAQDNYSNIHANNIVSLECMSVSGRPLHYQVKSVMHSLFKCKRQNKSH